MLAIAVAFALTGGHGTSNAQVTGATIVGTVTDSTGSVIRNAEVELIRESTGTIHQIKTNDSGSYTVPNLEPGTYTLSISAPGFGKEVTKGLTLEVAQNVQRDVTLKPGVATEQIDVTTSAPAIDLASS